jgi:hypothetical protein
LTSLTSPSEARECPGTESKALPTKDLIEEEGDSTQEWAKRSVIKVYKIINCTIYLKYWLAVLLAAQPSVSGIMIMIINFNH